MCVFLCFCDCIQGDFRGRGSGSFRVPGEHIFPSSFSSRFSISCPRYETDSQSFALPFSPDFPFPAQMLMCMNRMIGIKDWTGKREYKREGAGRRASTSQCEGGEVLFLFECSCVCVRDIQRHWDAEDRAGHGKGFHPRDRERKRHPAEKSEKKREAQMDA